MRRLVGILLLGAAAGVVACSGGGDSISAPGTTGGGGGGGGTPPPPTSGTIAGRVASSAGVGLAGATVTTTPATSPATTDAQGSFTIANVTPGSYTVSGTLSGYTAGTVTVTVAAGQTATANITLVAAGFAFTEVAQFQASTQGVSGLAISADGATLAFGEYGANTIKLMSVATRQVTRTLSGHTAPVTELAFSRDGRYLASQGTTNLPPATDGTVRVWDVASGAQLASVATGSAGVGDLKFSPDGSLLAGASGGDPLRVLLWTPASLAVVRTISNVFRKVAFSPSGLRLAALARDDRLHIMDVATGTEVSALTGHTGWVTTAVYNRAGTVIATAGEDRTVRLWDATTGAPLRTLSGHSSYPEDLEFSPDGTVLASLGSGINITRSGGSVSVTISSADRSVRLWNTSTGAAMTAPSTTGDGLGNMAFSSDWSILVTADGSSGRIRFFRR